jgi:hypothetical protein
MPPITDDALRHLLADSMTAPRKFHQMFGKAYGFTLKRILELSRQSHVKQVMAPAKEAIYQRIVAPDFSFQIDLTFWGHRDAPDAIMFVCIEMTSRKRWCEIIKDKSAANVTPVFETILDEVRFGIRIHMRGRRW